MAGKKYSFSMYVKNPNATTVASSIVMNFVQSDGTTSVTNITQASTKTIATADGWVRISGIFVAPTLATFASLTAAFDFGTGNTGLSVYVAQVLLEQADSLNPYFDASSVFYLQTEDVTWEQGSTQGTAPSSYYKNKVNALARLRLELPNHLPVGAQTALL